MTAKGKYAATELLEELQDALQHGSVARRVETLRRVTDLFVGQSADYSDEQIGVFDDVFNCLVEKIEVSARILLSERLAKHPMSPPRIIRTLAFDDIVEVAAPVLTHSGRLSEDALIANASAKSQGHLLAISRRATLSEKITDILVVRGEDAVVESTASNPGARFSDQGYDNLIGRTDANERIAIAVGSHKSIPRHQYLKLIARASRTVRDRLEAAHAATPDQISVAVKLAADSTQARAQAGADAQAAHHLVRSLFADDRLDDDQVLLFARRNKFDEINAALSCLADIEVESVEQIMIGSRSEGLLVLAKVAGVSWHVVEAIIEMRRNIGASELDIGDIEINQDSYDRLRVTTAQQVLRFHKMQHTASIMPDVA